MEEEGALDRVFARQVEGRTVGGKQAGATNAVRPQWFISIKLNWNELSDARAGKCGTRTTEALLLQQPNGLLKGANEQMLMEERHEQVRRSSKPNKR